MPQTRKYMFEWWPGKKGLDFLPNNKILDQSKLKAFAGDKINFTKKLKFALKRVENIVGRRGNTGFQYFLLFMPLHQKIGGGMGILFYRCQSVRLSICTNLT